MKEVLPWLLLWPMLGPLVGFLMVAGMVVKWMIWPKRSGSIRQLKLSKKPDNS